MYNAILTFYKMLSDLHLGHKYRITQCAYVNVSALLMFNEFVQ